MKSKSRILIYTLGVTYVFLGCYSAVLSLNIVADKAPLSNEQMAVLMAGPSMFSGPVFAILLMWLISCVDV